MDLASRDPAGSDEAGSGEVAAPDETMTATAPEDDARLDEGGSDELGTDARLGSCPGTRPLHRPKRRTRAPLVVDTVDYDDEGEMVIAGTAEPEADLHVYIDDKHVGDRRDHRGRATGSLNRMKRSSPGSYTLRVDQNRSRRGVVLGPHRDSPWLGPGPSCSRWAMPSWWCSQGNSLWRNRPAHAGWRHPLHRDLRGQQQPDPGSGAHLSRPESSRFQVSTEAGVAGGQLKPRRATT